MSHSTTTFRKIVCLYDEARALLDKRSDDWLTDDEQARFAEIRMALDSMWNKRRAELVFQIAGPPRIISAPDPRSQRQIARGIQPLPSGGDPQLLTDERPAYLLSLPRQVTP